MSPHDTRLTLRALSALLGYPSAELQAAAGEIRDALAAEGALPRAARAALDPLLDALRRDDLLDLQADYSDLFDRSPKLSLHLFEHVHGDSRERGPALVSLGEHYAARGFAIRGPELPDYLPMFLEFASCLPPAEARSLLAEPAHVFAALGERLAERRSPYAAVFSALLALAKARPDAEALAALRERGREEKSVDELWEEAPVDFGRPSQEAGRAAGIVARLRRAQDALTGARKA